MKRLLRFLYKLIGNCDHIFIVKFEKIEVPDGLPDYNLYRRFVFCARCGEVIQATVVKFTDYGAMVLTESGILYKRK